MNLRLITAIVTEFFSFQTEYDIKSYLEKIYQIPVIHIRTRIAMGKTERDRGEGYVIKKEDRKLAYVTLPKEVQFTFPDLYPSDAEAKKQRRDDEKSLDHSKDTFKKYLDRSKARRGLPAWFSI